MNTPAPDRGARKPHFWPRPKDLSEREIAAAREWIAQCVWADLDPDEVDDLTDRDVIVGIERHYEGGWPAFLEAEFDS